LDASGWLKKDTTIEGRSMMSALESTGPIVGGFDQLVEKDSITIAPLGVETLENSKSPVHLVDKGIDSIPSSNWVEPNQSVSSQYFTFNPHEDPISLHGCHGTKETDSSLNKVLDSLIPYLRNPTSTIPLPIYLGKFVYENLSWDGDASTS